MNRRLERHDERIGGFNILFERVYRLRVRRFRRSLATYGRAHFLELDVEKTARLVELANFRSARLQRLVLFPDIFQRLTPSRACMTFAFESMSKML